MRILADSSAAIAAAVTGWLLGLALLGGLLRLAVGAARLVRRARAGDAEARRAIVVGGALFAGALLVRWLVPERVPYTYNDEYEYLRNATRLRDGEAYGLLAQPPLLIHLYALAFRVLGSSSGVAFAVTAVLGSLSVPALYGALRAMSVRREVAVVAALLLLLHPLHVKHSGSASLEVVSLLFVLLAIGTFARWLESGGTGGIELLGFATSLFAALSARVENFALVPLFAVALAVAAARPGPARRAVRSRELLALAAVVVLAALPLPAAIAFHGRQTGWWQSELSPPVLLANNLSFWIGGSVATGKVALLLLLGGLVAAWRSSRAACLWWLGFVLVYSTVYVVHGVNLGYHVETLHPKTFAARSAGHDMFRFNLLLLPGVLFFLASGLVAAARLAVGAARRFGAPAATALGVATLVGLLVAGGEWAAWDPVALLRSPYNRPQAIAQFRFLERHLGAIDGPATCYTLPVPLAPFLGDRVAIVRLEDAADIRLDDQPALLYASTTELARPRARRVFEEIAAAFVLDEVASATAGRATLRLFRVTARRPGDSAAQPGG